MRSMNKKLTGFAFAVMAAFGGVFTTPSLALAAEADCLNGNVCTWTAAGYGGSLYQWSGAYIYQLNPFHCLSLSSSISNQGSSFKNRSGGGDGIARWFDRSDCLFVAGNAPSFTLGTGQKTSLASTDARNDKMSSIYSS